MNGILFSLLFYFTLHLRKTTSYIMKQQMSVKNNTRNVDYYTI